MITKERAIEVLRRSADRAKYNLDSEYGEYLSQIDKTYFREEKEACELAIKALEGSEAK